MIVDHDVQYTDSEGTEWTVRATYTGRKIVILETLRREQRRVSFEELATTYGKRKPWLTQLAEEDVEP